MVGAILGLVFLFTEGSIYGTVDKMWIPFCLATWLSTIRELVKDASDIEGDSFAELQTYPGRYGLKSTYWLLKILSITLCLFALTPWIKGYYGNIYLILLIIFVELPILWSVFFQLNDSSTVIDYKRTACFLKGVIIGGMIVILSTGF